MQEELKKIKEDFESSLENLSNLIDLEKLEQKFFSRKAGKMTLLMKELKSLSSEKKKEFGAEANKLKTELSELLLEKRNNLLSKESDQIMNTESIDVTQLKLPKKNFGHLHPVTIIQNKLEDLFTSMGFIVADGPELESEYYNFTAENIPEDHPARDMQDTFYIKGHSDWVMRTHTSSMQVRAMQENEVPMRVIIPGRCFRNEATDPRHEHTFYQLEGFVIDENISFADMKGVLDVVVKHLYGKDAKIRFRPKFYPFVEPGVNGEVTCFLCGGEGCKVCKGTGWLEIFGAGMIHPNVLVEGGIDPNNYQGFAFGFGLNRLVMLKYNIEDIRNFQSGDLRFLNQF
jgi:phenylalanyl-tRNA synthetase alpha chain